MATWIMHLRVAERLKDLLGELDEAAYYVGAIAPDSGRMEGNFTYIPSKDVSHWKREDVSYEQRFLDNTEFYKKYCVGETDLFKKSLFWGYYIHILTDTIYVRDIIHPYIAKMTKPYWKENIIGIRKGWYEIDQRFIAENPDYVPFGLIKTVEPFDNSFLDYFAPNDIYERIQAAIELYTTSGVDPECKFYTHTPEEAVGLIDDITEEITAFLNNNIFN